MLIYIALSGLSFVLALASPTHQVKDIPNSEDVESRIFYGENADIRNYPFYAGLKNCGAVIISPLWVLTAAHCVDNKKHYTVWVGGSTFKSSTEVPVQKIYIHPRYVSNNNNYIIDDVALILLKKPLKFNKTIQPVLLPYPHALEGVKNKTIEFIGRGIDEHRERSIQLQKSTMKVFSSEWCYRNYYPFIHDALMASMKMSEVNMKVICIIRENDLPGPCYGDSGSPLVQGNVLKGLASYGFDNCKAKDSFQVNVQYYLPWIKNITKLKY